MKVTIVNCEGNNCELLIKTKKIKLNRHESARSATAPRRAFTVLHFSESRKSKESTDLSSGHLNKT